MQSLWNRVLRWTTNCFYSYNNNTLYPEASISPLTAICLSHRLQFARRISLTSPTLNPVTACLLKSFISHPLRSVMERPLLKGINCPPRQWYSKTVLNPPLPIDQLCILLQSIQPPECFQRDVSIPLTTIAMIKEQVLHLWSSDFSPPDYYSHPFTIKPHLFISRTKLWLVDSTKEDQAKVILQHNIFGLHSISYLLAQDVLEI